MNEVKATHTPGPWTQQPARDYWEDEGLELQVISAGGLPVAFVPIRKGEYKVHSFANARLIAAAPDLLEALKALPFKYLPASQWAAEIAAAEAAIAKAEGQS